MYKENLGINLHCCHESLTMDIIDTLLYIYKTKNCEYSFISVLGWEDTIEEIFKCVSHFLYENNIAYEIDYIHFDKDDGFAEYGLCLSINDGVVHIGIENAEGNDDYKAFDCDYVYIDSDCNEGLIDRQIDWGLEVDLFMVSTDIE